jgi:hypothetical protein
MRRSKIETSDDGKASAGGRERGEMSGKKKMLVVMYKSLSMAGKKKKGVIRFASSKHSRKSKLLEKIEKKRKKKKILGPVG